MFQGLVKAALPTVAAAAFMALAATSSSAFTLSAPSLDKPTAASNIEQAYWVRGWAGVVRGVGATVIVRGVGATVIVRGVGATVIARGVGATVGAARGVTVGAARGATVGVRSFRWNGALYLTARRPEASRAHSSPADESRGAFLLGGQKSGDLSPISTLEVCEPAQPISAELPHALQFVTSSNFRELEWCCQTGLNCRPPHYQGRVIWRNNAYISTVSVPGESICTDFARIGSDRPAHGNHAPGAGVRVGA